MTAVRLKACADCGAAFEAVTCKKRCAPCQKAAYLAGGRAQYQKHKDKRKAAWKESYSDNPDKYRGYHYKHRYGVTREQVAEMHAAQRGACAICAKQVPLTGEYRTKLAYIDHCHDTGKVRGILCFQCNMLLGNASDKIDVLRAAISYLERAQ